MAIHQVGPRWLALIHKVTTALEDEDLDRVPAGRPAGVSVMSAPEEPVFLDNDDTSPKPTGVLCVLREHLSETIDLADIIGLLKE